MKLTTNFQINSDHVDQRLDQFLTSQNFVVGAIEISRSQIQKLIRDGQITVNDLPSKPSYKLRSGDLIVIDFLSIVKSSEIAPQKIPLKILFEDDQILVIDKHTDLIIHPAPNVNSGTLVNALIDRYGDAIRKIDRHGIVHRLDKNTTGVMIVAKTDLAFGDLTAQFKARTIDRNYVAIVCGTPKTDHGTITANLKRNSKNWQKMSIVGSGGRHAVTHFQIIETFDRFSQLDLKLETGRTHQIRVHLSHIGHPIVGDDTYGGLRRALNDATDPKVKQAIAILNRQALHAKSLAFDHPKTGDRLRFSTEPPIEMQNLIRVLK